MEIQAAAPAGEFQHPDILALKHMFEKNHWLIRIRWIYPIFIAVFFLVYFLLAGRTLISPRDALLVFLLPVIVNFLFNLDIRKKEKTGQPPPEYDKLLRWSRCSSISTWWPFP